MVMETLPSGTILYGRYRVERVLGSGGFGHVYLAVDLQTNQQYALKEYLVTGASGKAQLEHEARVLSQLRHPSLPAFQAAFDERGRYYVVLGYIEGSDLTDCLRVVRQRNEIVPLERILNWLISICEAVTFLHNQHPPIIHRDIKPDNIRITSNGTAILVDLGNAKASADGARTLFFIRHQGTPGYAPLEQYPGGTGTDTRSDDLPSLQEILAQNPPETSAGADSPRQFRLGVTKPAKPAPRHSRHVAQLGTLSPDLLNSLNSIISRAMAMKPKDRYQSVAEFTNDLRIVLAALPTSTQPPPTGSGRSIDPHSTQPDLPFIFEALQNSGGNTDPVSQDASSRPPSPATQPSSPDTKLHCPRCSAELVQSAAFCPRCGATLNSLFPKNSQASPPPSSQANPGHPASTANRDIVTEQTMRYTPLNPQSTTPERKPFASAAKTPVVPSSPSQLPSPMRAGTQAPSNNPAPFIVHSPTSQQVPPKPFMPSVTPPVIVPGSNRVQTPPVQSPPSALINNSPLMKTGVLNNKQKILIFCVITFLVVMLIIVFVILSRHPKSPKSSSSGQQEQHYSMQVQVFNYERNISICAPSATAHPGTGIWQCHFGIPATTGVTQRVDGTGARSTAGNYRSWLT
ncbi:MAG: zinc-ribbon domain-containing protein [Chloroflexi bacterium]|nr:MAG: zinc-ribbon domain-containing protein [Chloroflexota bacterium]